MSAYWYASLRLALYLGWNLFRLGIETFQKAEFASQRWKVKLEQVGPGVFFALFGAAVLVWSIVAPLSVPVSWMLPGASLPGKGSATQTAEGYITYAGQVGEGEKRRLAVAINTVELFCVQNAKAVLSKEKSDALSEAKSELTLFRDSLIKDQFGADAVKTYKDKIDAYLQSPDALSRTDRDLVEKLQPWIESTFLSSPTRGKK